LDDPRFANNEARVQHRDEIRAEIQSRLIGQTTEVWLVRLNDAGVPAGPVLDVISALNDPQIQYRNMVLEASGQKGENISILGFPIKQSVDAPELRCPAPELGEHNDEVFCQL
jgi:crotonobetainyl-CoA:carnitine CoA-transferase CaiB-like acyl-CoA transferase